MPHGTQGMMSSRIPASGLWQLAWQLPGPTGRARSFSTPAKPLAGPAPPTLADSGCWVQGMGLRVQGLPLVAGVHARNDRTWAVTPAQPALHVGESCRWAGRLQLVDPGICGCPVRGNIRGKAQALRCLKPQACMHILQVLGLRRT